MKWTLYLTRDEWYPVFELSEETYSRDAPEIELSAQEYADYRRVYEEFEMWQEKLAAMECWHLRHDHAKP